MDMDALIQRPPSLRMNMSSAASVTTLNTYRRGAGKNVFGGALDVDVQYDRQSAEFVSRLENNKLRVMIENYQRLNQGDEFWDNYSPETCTWNHVYDELNKVEEEYRRKVTNNFVRRRFRDDGLARTLAPLLEGIPENDGLGFLKGGLIIVFNAVKRRASSCEKIFACFREVPDLLKEAHEAMKRFPSSQELYICSCTLHEKLLNCLPRLITILLRNSEEPKIKKFAKSLFGDEVADVDRLLQPLRAAQNALAIQTNRLRDRQDDRMAKQVDHIHTEASLIRRNQHEHQHEVVAHLKQLHETGKSYVSFIEAQNAKIESLHAENEALRLQASRQGILNMAHQIFEEVLRNRYFNAEVMQRETTRQLCEAPVSGPVVHNLEWLSMILCSEFEGSCHVDDLYASLRQYGAFSNKALAQAAYLAETTQFRQWLQSMNSDLILVDAHCENTTSGRTSPMSVFCASLVQSLLNGPEQGPSPGSTNIVLYFFCGQHLYEDGPLAGPQGLIRSLTIQLILAWPQDISPPDLGFLSSLLPGRVSSAKEDLPVGIVCRIFYALTRQLPTDSTVHCIVDGLSYLETSLGGWSDETCEVVDCLQRCSPSSLNRGPQAVVKVLLTSPDRSTQVCEMIPPGRVVGLRAGNLNSSFVSPRFLTSSLQNQTSFSDLTRDEKDDEELAENLAGSYTC